MTFDLTDIYRAEEWGNYRAGQDDVLVLGLGILVGWVIAYAFWWIVRKK